MARKCRNRCLPPHRAAPRRGRKGRGPSRGQGDVQLLDVTSIDRLTWIFLITHSCDPSVAWQGRRRESASEQAQTRHPGGLPRTYLAARSPPVCSHASQSRDMPLSSAPVDLAPLAFGCPRSWSTSLYGRFRPPRRWRSLMPHGTQPGSHATLLCGTSRMGQAAPAIVNTSRRPSGRCGCASSTLAQTAARSRLSCRSLKGRNSTWTASAP